MYCLKETVVVDSVDELFLATTEGIDTGTYIYIYVMH